jgi:hypothetical protein
MRELILSLGFTILTGTLLFVYFRNKHNGLDGKVNLVFQTIQDHNEKMQQAAEEEMMRVRAFQQSMGQEEMMMQHMNDEVVDELEVNKENLIDVSDDEEEEDEDASGSDSDDDSVMNKSEDEEADNDSEVENVVEELQDLGDTKIIDISNLPKMDYTKLTKSELKKLCDEKSITYAKSANKAKLVELLIGYDSSQNSELEHSSDN